MKKLFIASIALTSLLATANSFAAQFTAACPRGSDIVDNNGIITAPVLNLPAGAPPLIWNEIPYDNSPQTGTTFKFKVATWAYFSGQPIIICLYNRGSNTKWPFQLNLQANAIPYPYHNISSAGFNDIWWQVSSTSGLATSICGIG